MQISCHKSILKIFTFLLLLSRVRGIFADNFEYTILRYIFAKNVKRIYLMHGNTELILEINEKMNEDRSISNEVTLMSTEVFYRIMSIVQPSSSSTEMLKRYEHKYGEFEYSKLNISFNVSWDFYNIGNETPRTPEMKQFASADLSKKAISITIVAINGRINNDSVIESIQHEISHFFEVSKRQGVPYKNMFQYKLAVTILQQEEKFTEIMVAIAEVIYISYKFEQRAFGNGAYRYLMNHTDDYFHNFNNAIKKTKLYQYLTLIDDDIELLKDNSDAEYEITETFKRFEIPYEDFMDLAKSAREGLVRMCGRIKSKAIDDYERTHNIHSSYIRETKEGKELREKYLMKLNDKYFCK